MMNLISIQLGEVEKTMTQYECFSQDWALFDNPQYTVSRQVLQDLQYEVYSEDALKLPTWKIISIFFQQLFCLNIQ